MSHARHRPAAPQDVGWSDPLALRRRERYLGPVSSHPPPFWSAHPPPLSARADCLSLLPFNRSGATTTTATGISIDSRCEANGTISSLTGARWRVLETRVRLWVPVLALASTWSCPIGAIMYGYGRSRSLPYRLRLLDSSLAGAWRFGTSTHHISHEESLGRARSCEQASGSVVWIVPDGVGVSGAD